MKSFLAVAISCMAAFPARADDPKPSPTLKIGDRAPALTVTKWHAGDFFLPHAILNTPTPE